MVILCFDVGSSSLKFALYEAADPHGECKRVIAGEADMAQGDPGLALERVWQALGRDLDVAPSAAGHRLVFGGERYVEPTFVDDAVMADLEAFVSIEPLHLRRQLDLIYALRRRFPNLDQAACFDTAFHHAMPAIAKRLPLPRDIDRLVQRYGFHGLSYEYIASKLDPACGRTVVAHLGSGASLCAMNGGEPVDTTMGFSALGGLMMGTRPGDLDPGILLQLLGADGLDRAALVELLYERCGLLGVSGLSANMGKLLEAARTQPAAREAVDLFVYQLVKHLGAMVAVLGGLDTLVFTAGIGENAPAIRAAACDAFAYLGLRLDRAANDRNDALISQAGSRVAVRVIPTDENLMIARHTRDLMAFAKSSQSPDRIGS